MASLQDALIASQLVQYIARLIPQLHQLTDSYKVNAKGLSVPALGQNIVSDADQFAPFMALYDDLKAQNPDALAGALATMNVDMKSADEDVASLKSALSLLKSAPKTSHADIAAASDSASQLVPKYVSLF